MYSDLITFSHKLSYGITGLYRYRVGDVLQVTGFYNNAPQFKFIGRRNVILSIDSDKTNEEDLHKSITTVKEILEKQNYLLIEYTSYADSSSVPGHYVLFWEIKLISEKLEPGNMQCLVHPELIESCCIAIEESLDYVYRRCRTHDRYVAGIFPKKKFYFIIHTLCMLMKIIYITTAQFNSNLSFFLKIYSSCLEVKSQFHPRQIYL